MITTVKLREWAEKQGISYHTTLRWFHAGTLPVEAEQVATGAIIVKLQSIPADPQRRSLRSRVFIGSENKSRFSDRSPHSFCC
jgi:predicted site-specific integrase-resolvase